MLTGLATVVLLFGGCGNGATREVTLAEVVTNEANYNGDTLRVAGVIVRFDNPEHYVIEDERSNRIAVSPNEEVAAFVGEAVIVTGRFSYSEDRGRRIELGEISIQD